MTVMRFALASRRLNLTKQRANKNLLPRLRLFLHKIMLAWKTHVIARFSSDYVNNNKKKTDCKIVSGFLPLAKEEAIY